MMGFITPDPYSSEPNFITPTEAVPREKTPQSGGQMVSDAFLLNNDVVNVYRKLFSEQYPVDPDHNPAEFIKGTHYDRNYRDNFVGSTSEQDTRARMRRIDEEEAAKARSAESGPMGTVLDLGAGVLSPTVFLPAGQIVRSARGGYSALKSALSVGVAGGLQTAAQEAILQGTQETRTLHESLINVGSGTLLAGILGAGGSKLLQHFETRQAEAAVARARLQVDAHNGVDILNTPPTEGFDVVHAAQPGPVAGNAFFDVFHGSPHDFPAVAEINFADGRPSVTVPLGQQLDPALISEIQKGSATVKDHPFGKFDIRKIGTGEGAQSYGHGLYFAESRAVAEDYKTILGGRRYKALTDDEHKLLDQTLIPTLLKEKGADYQIKYYTDAVESSKRQAIEQEKIGFPVDGFEKQTLEMYQKKLAAWKKLKADDSSVEGAVYKVRIHADREHMLDWDNPLSEQPKAVRNLVENLGIEIAPEMRGAQIYKAIENHLLEKEFEGRADLPHPDELNPALKNVTQKLHEAGIPGIKYLDQGSRPLSPKIAEVETNLADTRARIEAATAKGHDTTRLQKELAVWEKSKAALEGEIKQTSNFVIFDDKLLTIIEKNGEKIDVRPFTPEATPVVTPASVGAAATDARQLEMFAAYPGMNTRGRSVSPTRTLLNATSLEVRKTAADLASTPYRMKENVPGTEEIATPAHTFTNVLGETVNVPAQTITRERSSIATTQGPPVDIQQRMAIDGTEYEIGQALKGHYSDYFFGEQRKAPVLQSRYQRMTGASDKMSYDEFKAEVGKAWMNNGTHELPQASAAAQAIMEKVEDWAKRADVSIEGFKRGEQAPGEAYFPHLWNKKLIQGQKPEFINWLTGIYKTDQRTKQGAQERIGAYHGALTSHTDNVEKLTAKIAKLNEDVDVIAARAEETTRINKFANQRATTLREASKPKETFTVKWNEDANEFQATTPDGKVIGSLSDAFPEGAGTKPAFTAGVGVDEPWRRKGVATALYEEFAARHNGNIGPAGNTTPEAWEFWLARYPEKVVAMLRDEAKKLAADVKTGDFPASYATDAINNGYSHPRITALAKDAFDAEVAGKKWEPSLPAATAKVERVPRNNLDKARGGAVFETKVRNRGNELADRASGKLAAIDELEQKLAKEIASHDEMRAKIEAELGKWEGTSSTEAKSAMKARAKAEADRIARAAAKSEEPPTKRLTSADADVDDAVRRILESRRDRTDVELRERASETTDRIIGSPDGRLPYDEHLGGPQIGKTSAVANRGALAHRRLDVTNAQAAPWIEQDAEHVLASYMRTVVPDVLLSEKFGDPEMTVAFKQINESYNHLIDQTKQPKERIALGNERDNAIKVMAAIRDRLRGVYGWSENTSQMAKVAQSVKVLNNISDLGSSAIASLSDFAGPLFRWGVTAAIRDGWAPFFQALATKSEEGGRFVNQMRAIGIGIDVATNARQHSMDEITGAYKPGSPIERTLQTVNDKFFIANGLAHLTDMQKMIAAHAAVHEVINISRRVSEGKATAREIGNMAEAGIDRQMGERIWREFNKPGAGEIVGKVYLPNTATWTDRAAADAFNGAIYREVNIAVVTPGQEKPLFLSRPVGSLLGQFKAFTAAANERILVANLQRRDAQSLSGVVAAIGLGMLSYKINALTGGQPTSDKPADWFREGVSRSGMLGWLEEGNAVTAKISAGKLDMYRLAGSDKPLSRYAGRGAFDMALGPTAGKLKALTELSWSAFSGGWAANDTHQMRRLAPFENMWQLRGWLNQVEETTNSHFNIPERRDQTLH